MHFLARAELIDRISIIQAPILIGGQTTPNLISGPDLTSVDGFDKLINLELESVEIMEHSFLYLQYLVKPKKDL